MIGVNVFSEVCVVLQGVAADGKPVCGNNHEGGERGEVVPGGAGAAPVGLHLRLLHAVPQR